MTERPILFSGPMVRAILEGRKTQTRRAVKPQWSADVDEVSERPALDRVLKCVVSGHSGEWEDEHGLDERRRCPYGQPGDRLWVKETWFTPEAWDCVKPTDLPGGRGVPGVQINYAADLDPDSIILGRLRPSIFMRRWMSRITIEVTAVRVERLQEISEEDAKAEGLAPIDVEVDGDHLGVVSARDQFAGLWDSINGSSGPGSWDANPWVWVVEFKRVEP